MTASRQLDGLAAAYEGNGVKVHRPREFTGEELASDPQPGAQGVLPAAPADCVWAIGRNYIELAEDSLAASRVV
jgi:hypothetical protein